MNTSSLILLASLTLAGTTIAKQNLKPGKHPSYMRTVLAAIAAGFLLSMVAAASDAIARPLAWLVIVGAITGNGSALFTYIGKLGK
jgi:hypothetical protein